MERRRPPKKLSAQCFMIYGDTPFHGQMQNGTTKREKIWFNLL